MADSANKHRDSLADSHHPEREKVTHIAPPEAIPVFRGHLFSLKNNRHRRRRRTQQPLGKAYDYEEKYPEDEFGEETFEEARLWKVFNDESDLYNSDKIEAWRDALDVLLVFIGLFSAIVTTFVIESSKSFEPDYGQLTAAMLYHFLNSTTSGLPALPTNPLEPPQSPTHVWVNGLWFTSLAISLSTALITVVTKQWLYHYMSPTSGTSQDLCRVRQFRFAGLQRYHVPMIIDLLPVALHVALALFLVGLVLFILPLHPTIAGVVGAITGLAYFLYMLTTVLSILDPQCPYRSPLSTYMYSVVVYVAAFVTALSLPKLSRTRGIIGHPLRQQTPHTLQDLERQAVHKGRDQLDVDALLWLYETSSNSTVRRIAVEAVGGLATSVASAAPLAGIIIPYFNAQMDECTMDGRQLVDMGEDYTRLLEIFKTSVSHHFGLICDTPAVDSSTVYRDTILPRPADNHPPGELTMPITTWRLWFRFVGIGPVCQDPFMLWKLLEMDIFRSDTAEQDVAVSELGSVTLASAFRSTPYLRSLVVASLARGFGIEAEIGTMERSQLFTAILKWAISKLLQYEPAVHIRPILEISMGHLNDIVSQGGLASATRDLLCASIDAFCDMSLISHEEVVSWKCLRHLAAMRYTLGDETKHASSINVISSLLSHSSVRPYKEDDDDVTQFMGHLEGILADWLKWTVSPKVELYDFIRSADLIPRSSEETDGTFRHLMWLSSLPMTLIGLAEWKVPLDDPQIVLALDYMHEPKRLLYLSKAILVGNEEKWHPFYAKDSDSLLVRIGYLAKLRPDSRSWTFCFKGLIALLHDDEFIDSICLEDEDDLPRQRLSEALRALKGHLHVDLSGPKFDVPCFSDDDQLITDDSSETQSEASSADSTHPLPAQKAPHEGGGDRMPSPAES